MPMTRLMCVFGLALSVVLCPESAFGQDCNNNGVPDNEDIFNGDSLDCDSNGVPDECQPPTPLTFRIQSDSFSTSLAESVLLVRAETADVTLESLTPVVATIGTVIFDAGTDSISPTGASHSIDTFALNDVGPMVADANGQDFEFQRTIAGYQVSFLNGDTITLEFPDCNYVVEMTPQSGAANGTPPAPGEDAPPIQTTLTAEFVLVIDCPADVDGNRNVNILDLLDLLDAWGPCPAPCAEDVNEDGIVDILDLLQLLADWGTCP